MKIKKRTLALMLCLALAAVAVGGTLAYLTDTDEVTNTFTVGDVKIALDEAKVDLMGTPIANADRVKANEYKLIPGHKYTKDPTVTVKKGSEACYVRLLVTANKVTEWTAICGENFDLGTIFTDYSSEWQRANIMTNNDGTVTYEYRYKETVTPTADANTKLPALFTGFKVPGTITNEQLATVNDFKINIVAQAIQADGFDNAAAAWEKFPKDAPTNPEPGE